MRNLFSDFVVFFNLHPVENCIQFVFSKRMLCASQRFGGFVFCCPEQLKLHYKFSGLIQVGIDWTPWKSRWPVLIFEVPPPFLISIGQWEQGKKKTDKFGEDPTKCERKEKKKFDRKPPRAQRVFLGGKWGRWVLSMLVPLNPYTYL